MTSSESRILDLIPEDVFKSKDLFHEVLKECWNQIHEDQKEDLKHRYLPKGELFSTAVRDETVLLLLDGRLGMFEDNPVDRIYFNLKISKFAPDIKQTLKEVKALQLKAQQLKEKEYQMKIWSEISMRRKCLFKSSLYIGIDEPIRSIKSVNEDWSPYCSLILGKKESVRVNRQVDDRYHKELQKLTLETGVNFLSSSDDEDRDEIKCIKVENTALRDERKLLRMINMYKRKRKTDVPLDDERSAITLNEIIERVESHRIDEICLELPPIPAAIRPKVRRKSKPSSSTSKSNVPGAATAMSSKATVSKINDKLSDSIGAAIFARKMELNLNKKSSVTADVFDFDDDSPLDTPTSSSKEQPNTASSISNQVSQIISSLTNPPPKCPTPVSPPFVYDEPPPSFFSLIRNVFQEHAPVDRKLTLHKLEELVKEKLKTIDPKLGWSHESVQSAMNFLSYYSETPPNPPTPTNESQDSSSSLPASDMVPLVDYKEKNQQWQWIGGCRDGDDLMKRLSDDWASDKDRNPSSLSDPNAPVPPPLFPTQWIVKPATPEDQRMYREQEATRYNNPSKAFTYRIHDYEAVVGPVKGSAVINILNNANTNNPLFTPAVNCPSASPNKAREHSLLVNDRPPFVTLLSLVRDAAARLPNGEGTRADICELLKDSQYLLPSVSDQQINQIVSGALDRLHYEKDPCVKYDTNRKVWIYLHRNRTESDFERLHEMQVAAAKAKRNLTKTRKPSVSTKTSIASPPAVGKCPQKGVQRPSPCKSSDSSSSSNTPILPNSITPIAARIAVSPLAPKPVAIVPQSRNVESNLLDILTKSTPQTYQFTQGNQNFLLNKPCQDSFTQSSDRTNQVILKPNDTGKRNTNLSPVVSVISVSSLTPVNRVITTSPMMMMKDKTRTMNQSIQKIGVVTANQFNAGGDQVGSRQVRQVQVNQPMTRPVQYVNQPQTSVTLTTGSQSVSIPSSMLLSGRPSHVVLGGKSYVMATTSGGSIVLHPQNSIPIQTGQVVPNPSNLMAGVGQPLSMRTLQGIKVIPVPTQFHAPGSNQRVTPVIATHPVASQNGTVQTNQQFVARLIPARPGQIQGNQMIIPSSGGYQQVILTPASHAVPALTVSKQQTVNQAQMQPINSFHPQIGTSQAPQINSVKNNIQ